MNICNSKFQLKDLSNIDLKEILNYYKNEENNDDDTDLDNIYYYIYYYNKNNKEKGDFSDNFLEKNKNQNMKICKKTI